MIRLLLHEGRHEKSGIVARSERTTRLATMSLPAERGMFVSRPDSEAPAAGFSTELEVPHDNVRRPTAAVALRSRSLRSGLSNPHEL